MSFGVGDGIAAVSVAYGLYSKVWVVARRAPEDFRDLLVELDLVKQVLFKIAETLTDVEDSLAQNTIRRCEEILDRFRPLFARYQRLASTDRKVWSTRAKYVTDQKTVSECRRELQHIWQRVAAISAWKGTYVKPLEHLSLKTLTGDNLQSSSDVGKRYEATSSASVTSEGTDAFAVDKMSDTGFQHIEFIDEAYISPPPSGNNGDLSRQHRREASRDSERLVPTFTLTSRNSEQASGDTVLSHPSAESPHNTGVGSNQGRSYISAFAHSTKKGPEQELFLLQDSWLRRLARPQIPINAVMKEWCEEGVKELQRNGNSETDVESWLIIAVWWLLKSRTLRIVFERAANSSAHNQVRPTNTTWPVRTSTQYTAVDLVKSNYILQEVILARVGTHNPLQITEAQWKVIQDLSIAIEEEIRCNEDVKKLDSLDVLDHDAKGFTEPFVQQVEYLKALPCSLDSIEGPQRWLAVDMQHCGGKDERVLFRTFVNAQLGDRRICRKSTTAPYLLLLWSRLGSSEIILSLVNQHGTVHLARNLTLEDIEYHQDHTGPGTEFEFDFPSQNAVIRFLSEEDIQEFLEHPRKLFAASRSRAPKDCELLVFRHALDTYVSRYPSRSQSNPAGGSRGGTSAHTACEISLFEMVPHELWKSTRRLVISSTPGVQHQPWCVDFFLPLSMVQVRRVLNDVKLIWSNFTVLDEQGDGVYGTKYSYVYKPEKPDFELHVVFADTQGATAFEHCILHPFDTPFEAPEHVEVQKPIFQTPSTAQELQVYRLRDRTAIQRVGYYALCLTDNAPNTNSASEIYYLHRDLDFQLSTGPNYTVDFSDLHVPNYLSNITDMVTKPEPGSSKATFFAAARRRKDAHFAFENVGEVSRLMKMLLGWNLKLIRHVKSVSISSRTRFFPQWQEDVVVTLWQRSSERNSQIRLAMRTGDSVDLRWTTAALNVTSECARKSDKVVFKNVCLQQGHQIDGKLLVATNPSEEEQPRDMKGTLTIRLANPEHAQTLITCIYRLLDDWSSCFTEGEIA